MVQDQFEQILHLQGSLMANMVLGMLILNKRYTALKYLSVIIITLGIAISTIASGQSMSANKKEENQGGNSKGFLAQKFVTISG